MRQLTCIAAMTAVVATSAPAATLIPDFSAATFPAVAGMNPWFPLVAGHRQVLVAEGEEDGEVFTERVELTVTGPGPVILGVQTTIQRDRTFEDGRIVEDTFDYFAIDAEGNVWYFGEDVTNYIYDDDGMLIGTTDDSAWLAGVDGALPGWIMPAAPVVGLSYYQEVAAAAEALDQAVIYAVGETVEIDGVGTFTDVVVTLETTELDPDAREFKYYAPGIGLIRIDEDLTPDLEDPELVFELVSEVPLPAGLPLLLTGVLSAALLLRGSGRRREAV